ncbi:MAG: AAA family ATPase [Solirubrobacterales bacterium]|nr:AAA family ATPase [Solirubrobacterales bacterium]
MTSLGARLARTDAQRFAGRERELARLEHVLSSASPASVALVHGPGGIGKSALLREATRRAARLGFSVHWIDGRELPPVPDALEDAVSPARSSERPIVVLDSYERVEALGPYLRGAVLPSLPDRAVVLIAARKQPDERWSEGGRDGLVVELAIGPLPDAEGGELLRRRGVDSARRREELLRWAGGVPLALTLAAAANDDTDAPELDAADVVEALIRRLIGDDMHGSHLRTLGVAAIARVTTPTLLREVLPDLAGDEEYRWLASRTFVEPLGDGVAPHDLVARALRSELRRADLILERDLRRRIADSLHARATSSGDLMVAIDLAHLAESPALRWGFSWEAAARSRVDDPRPDDAAALEAALDGGRHRSVWEGSRRYFAEAPEHVAVVRGADDAIHGYSVAVTPGSAPPFSDEDPILGPRLRHARTLEPRGETVLWRDTVDLTREPAAGVIGLLGIAGVLRSASSNPRYGYLPINPRLAGAREFAVAAGGRHVGELDVRVGDELLECFLIDWGRGGLLAAQRELVYRELGLEPPPRVRDERAVSVEVVRHALRNLEVPSELTRSELAAGEGVEERAESVRTVVAEAVERAFGDDPAERLSRDVLARGYLDPAASHEAAAAQLNLSRSAYFRRLRGACERVADYVSARRLSA